MNSRNNKSIKTIFYACLYLFSFVGMRTVAQPVGANLPSPSMCNTIVFIVMLGMATYSYFYLCTQFLSNSLYAQLFFFLVVSAAIIVSFLNTTIWFDDDLYRYIYLSYIQNLGLDPYNDVPAQFLHQKQIQTVVHFIGYPDIPSVYSPFTHNILGILGDLIGYTAVYWQLFNGIIYLLTFALFFCTYVVFPKLKFLVPLFFGFQPVFIVDFANGGHMDIYCLFAFAIHLFFVCSLSLVRDSYPKFSFIKLFSILSAVFSGLMFNIRPTFMIAYAAFALYLWLNKRELFANKKILLLIIFSFVIGCILPYIYFGVHLLLQAIPAQSPLYLMYLNYLENTAYFARYWVFFSCLTDVFSVVLSNLYPQDLAWSMSIKISYIGSFLTAFIYGCIKWAKKQVRPSDLFTVFMSGCVLIPVVNSWYFAAFFLVLCSLRRKHDTVNDSFKQIAPFLIFPLFAKIGILYWVSKTEPLLVFKISWCIWLAWAVYTSVWRALTPSDSIVVARF